MPAKKEEYYEIVSVSPFKEAEKKSGELEKEINELKTAIRGSISSPKTGAASEEFMEKILGMMTNSQQVVSDVAKSNRELAQKVQLALDSTNKTNKQLSERLTKILDYFTEAGESEDTESEGIDALKAPINSLVEQNKKTQVLLESIEKNLKRRIVRKAVPRTRRVPPTSLDLPKPIATPMQTAAPAPMDAPPPLKEGELPPPPLPP